MVGDTAFECACEVSDAPGEFKPNPNANGARLIENMKQEQAAMNESFRNLFEQLTKTHFARFTRGGK